jgi:hypothetical protein
MQKPSTVQEAIFAMVRLTTAALILASTAVMAAQTSTPQTSAPTPAPSGDQQTVTGCLRGGSQHDTFVLAVAADTRTDPARTQSSAAGDRSTAASPHATGTAGAAVKTITYQLVPAGGVQLASLVGKRVQVTGRVAPTAQTKVSKQSTETSPAARDATPHDSSTPVVSTTTRATVELQRLTVTDAKAIGGTCQ